MGADMVRKFLAILDKWCKRNHFDINLKKSGYFAIHNNSSDDDFNFQFQDKPFKQVDGLKYLGFLISKDGSWDSHLEMLIKRAISRLAISYDFLMLSSSVLR